MMQLLRQFIGGESWGLRYLAFLCLSRCMKLSMRARVLLVSAYDLRWDLRVGGRGRWSMPYMVVCETIVRHASSCRLNTGSENKDKGVDVIHV